MWNLNTLPRDTWCQVLIGNVFYLRLIVYNTLQHIKRLGTKSLSLVWTNESNVLSSIKGSLLKSIHFILTQVLPKIDSSKLRCEAYMSLGAQSIADIQDSLKKFFLTSSLLQESAQKVSLYVRSMCQTLLEVSHIFIENCFSDFYICYILYRQLVSGIYCSERITKKWLQERPLFGLKRKEFLFPNIRLNLALLDIADLKKERKSIEEIFGEDMWNICLLLFVKEAIETGVDMSKCNPIVREAAENLEIIMGKIFPSGQTNYDSTYVSLKTLLEKQLTFHCSFEKSITCHLLLLIYSSDEYFEALTSLAQKLNLCLKVNERYFVYIPCGSVCDILSLKRLVKIFTLEQCKREMRRNYISEDVDRFKILESLFRDSTQVAINLHRDARLPGKILMMDLDAHLRCLFATFGSEPSKHLFEYVSSMSAFIKFVAIVTLYYNILQVPEYSNHRWNSEVKLRLYLFVNLPAK